MRHGGKVLAATAVLAGLVASGPAVQASEDPGCAAGVRFTTNSTEAASGLRVMAVEVANCGTEALELNGYPQVSLFDGEGQPLDVAILDGSGGITSLPGFDDPPQPITVLPGETASSAFVWRNTRISPWEPPQLARHVELATAPGAVRQPLVALPPHDSIHIDLGDTGRMGVRAWYR
ncbi:DUF4232 domain-containing protein [Lentzea sp. NPDC059081]|uniref:DUF4232 domain-containing protein n=1 Tax=Lentzea sp. NPDC059081 TaxID=3346719 RepID=UPI0036827B76